MIPAFKYLSELRLRLLYCLAIFCGFFFVLLPYHDFLYQMIATPLLQHLPRHQKLITTKLTTPLWIPIKCVLIVTLGVALPFFIHQFWKFINPALYQRERFWMITCLMSGIGLFYLGILFSYFIVLPFFSKISIDSMPSHTQLLPSIEHYLDLFLQWGLIFGFVFETPVILIGLVKLNLIKHQTITQQRRYIIVLIFTIAMFLTPPDIISQIILAIPLWLLFELGVLLARYVETKK